MEPPRGSETNPSAEFFGFDACQFVEHAHEATKFYSQDGLKKMKEILIDDELTAKHSEAIEAGFPSAEAKFDRILEKNFDKFELYAQRNILRVPAHIDPTGGMPDTWLNQCSTTTTAADEEAMDGEIAELRRKIQKAKFVHDAMDHKLGEYTSQLAQAQSLFKALEQSDKLVSAAGVEDLPRAVQSVVEGGREVAIVESQFKALDQNAFDATQVSSAGIEAQLGACKKAVGSASTRDLGLLGKVLGSENVAP